MTIVLLVALIMASSLWVYLDATKHNIGKIEEVTDERKVVSKNSAGGWAFWTMALWIVAFPMYLLKRNQKIVLAKEFPVIVEKRKVKAALLGSFGVLYTAFTFAGTVQASLPACDSADTKSIVKQFLEQPQVGLQFVDLKDVTESGFDSKREIRVCNATLVTTSFTENGDYKVYWHDQEAKIVAVELMD